MTNIDLNLLAENLEEVVKKLEQKPKTEEYVLSIKHNIMYLRMYQKNLVEEMVFSADKMKVGICFFTHITKTVIT